MDGLQGRADSRAAQGGGGELSRGNHLDDHRDASHRGEPVCSLLVALLVLAVLAGCGEPERELSLPETVDDPADTSTETSAETTLPDESVASPEAEAASSTTEPPEDEAFTPVTVQFDPDDPPDQATLDRLVFGAIEAEFHNVLWCWENAAVCDLGHHVGPSATEARRAAIESDFLASFTDDGVHQIEVQALSDQEFNLGDGDSRLVGAVVACEEYRGTYSYPDAAGDDLDLDVGQVTECDNGQRRRGTSWEPPR